MKKDKTVLTEEIGNLFPKDFTINKDGDMVALITLENLNKIMDHLDFLVETNHKIYEEAQEIVTDRGDRIQRAIDYINDNISYGDKDELIKILEGKEDAYGKKDVCGEEER